MRNRHVPRLCRHCREPMARQEDACWRCCTQCASPIALGALPGGAPYEAGPDEDRWFDEGGRFDREVPGPMRTAAETG